MNIFEDINLSAMNVYEENNSIFQTNFHRMKEIFIET